MAVTEHGKIVPRRCRTARAHPCVAAIAAVVGIASAPAAARAAEPAIIPIPASVTARAGAFRLDRATPIVVPEGDREAMRAAEYLEELTGATCALRLPLRTGRPRDHAVNFFRDQRLTGAEAYRLEVTPHRVSLGAPTPAGLLYGAVTFAQLACPGIARGGAIVIPAVRIADRPRFAWRGLMLDSARHFQSPEFIHRFIDWMALHKLNVLHWHLTDDQAWRLEIRRYPALTAVGAWRVPAGPAAQADLDPATGRARQYGGFYSQAAVKAIVAHARARGVTIVPEIEMPGHASAALAAYPALAATATPPTAVPSDWGIYRNVYNLDEATFAFLEEVLTEVLALFPGPYVHIGGDEVEKAPWERSAQARSRASALGIAPASVPSYFTQRISRFLLAHGRRPVGWDEILEPGLPPQAVVMSWRGLDGALAAASKGYDTVLSPWPTLYFDYRQSAAADEPPGRARVISLADVYAFEPMPAQLNARERRHVLGLQANIWTEHIRTEERVGYMTFPRAAAIAELGWSPPERRSWPDFKRRMQAELARYDALGIPHAAHVGDDEGASQGGAPSAARALRRSSHELKLCSDNIALALEDDAPLRGPRAVFLLDIQNPCWIFPDAPLDTVSGIVAAVGQVPFNFQIGEEIKKIVFPKPATAEGELEVHLDRCDGELLARLPLAPAVGSNAVTVLPRAEIAPRRGRHDLCLRFAQPRLEPLWALDWIELEGP